MVVVTEPGVVGQRACARAELTGFAGPALLAQQSDERLVELVRDGDQNAFAAIVARYRAPLERHCRRTLAPSRAEDALQQTFANAYVALSRGARPQALAPWLYAIARNSSLDALRDREVELLEEAWDAGARAQTHDIVAGRESLQSVVRAVVGLPARQREVIVRQEFEGLSQQQIAADLGLTTGAVRQLAHRARSTVRSAAAAIVPAPLWRLLPWQLSPSGGGELALSSALGAIAGKGLAVLLVAGAAGGAVELSAGHTAAPPARSAAAQRATAAGAASSSAAAAAARATRLGLPAGLPLPVGIATPGGRAAAGQRDPAAGGAPDPGAGADAGPATAAGPVGAQSAADAAAPATGATHQEGAGSSPAIETSSGGPAGAHDESSAAEDSAEPAGSSAAQDAAEDVPSADAPDPADAAAADTPASAELRSVPDAADTGPSGVNRGSLPPAAAVAPAPAASASGSSG